ncbi:hypothetical protein NEOLI_004740 [Neolecta irregularis DAH-3]|uniref:Uncharacterized protein n=1 Tax=Neolecta irregularis (strain DAH-3) TaxID=1198029 RepID=A0A1U7LMF1_NEOID|nr:hypothetical protein NEOLI_004740 [Neolecta irregularis DAH-3]|eukprot:OLL23835.1 hypothetical protein NEOLI_004740 [Neolecta irregularis DAH-3]
MLSTPFIALFGIVAASPVLNPPRATKENIPAQSEIPNAPQLMQSSAHHSSLVQSRSSHTAEPLFNPNYFHPPRFEELIDLDETPYVDDLLVIMKHPDEIDIVKLWDTNFNDYPRFLKASSSISSIWEKLQILSWYEIQHSTDGDSPEYEILIASLISCLKELDITITYHDADEFLKGYKNAVQTVFAADYSWEFFQQYFTYIYGKIRDEESDQRQLDSIFTPKNGDAFAEDEPDWEDMANYFNEEFSQSNKINRIWEMMAIVNFPDEFNCPAGPSGEYFQLLDLLIKCLEGRDITFTHEEADEFFKMYVITTEQMDSKKVNRAYFETFIDEYVKTSSVESNLRDLSLDM